MWVGDPGGFLAGHLFSRQGELSAHCTMGMQFGVSLGRFLIAVSVRDTSKHRHDMVTQEYGLLGSKPKPVY